MDSDMVADLKQFISAELSQQVAGLEERLDAKIDATRDEILDAIGDIITKRDEAVDEQLSDHETRIAKSNNARHNSGLRAVAS